MWSENRPCGRYRLQVPRGIRSRPRSSTPNRGRKLRRVCTTARGQHVPLQDVIGLDRTNRANPAAGAGRRNTHRRQTGGARKSFQYRTNLHPSNAWDQRVGKRTRRRGADAPNRHLRQPSPQRPDTGRQIAEKPPQDDRQELHCLIRSHNAGWFLPHNTEPVENSLRTARGLRLPLGPPKALVIWLLSCYYNLTKVPENCNW